MEKFDGVKIMEPFNRVSPIPIGMLGSNEGIIGADGIVLLGINVNLSVCAAENRFLWRSA